WGGPEAAHKLEVLRGHCDTVGRDYEQIEKTTMLALDPSTTKDDFVREAAAMREAGFAAAYVFARDITEPEKIIDLLGAAVPDLAYIRLTMAARPWRPSMHIVSRRYRPSRRCSSRRPVARMRAPVAPTGWPSEMPEPLTLSRSKSLSPNSHARVTAST